MMKIERSSFLFLTTVIAAATMAVACSAASDDDVDSSGADMIEAKAPTERASSSSSSSGNPAPAKHCIANPARDEAKDGTNFSPDICIRLASTIGPKSVAATDEQVLDQCSSLNSAFRKGMATDLAACIEKVDAARRDNNGLSTKPIDKAALTACSAVLFDICDTAIDSALAATDASGKTRCERIVDMLGPTEIDAGPDGPRMDLDAKACDRVLSGIRPAWRPQMEICVKELVAARPDKSTIFTSCIGGLLADPNGMGPDPAAK